MVLVDTSVWIDYFNGRTTAQTEKLDALLSSTVVVVGDLIVAEVLQGFSSDTDYKVAKNLLTELELVSLCNIARAIKAADHYRLLRQQGITIRKTIDCLIATFCIENHLPLLYSDRDFDPFAKLLGLKPVILL
ncbi:MAG: type II toxin-antitoxin system VapC family toxin [Methylococcales bacterium]